LASCRQGRTIISGWRSSSASSASSPTRAVCLPSWTRRQNGPLTWYPSCSCQGCSSSRCPRILRLAGSAREQTTAICPDRLIFRSPCQFPAYQLPSAHSLSWWI
jgi:hypothetical protein